MNDLQSVGDIADQWLCYLMFVDLMLQNAQAIIDLNISVQERDKSIATKEARYAVSVSVYLDVSVCLLSL